MSRSIPNITDYLTELEERNRKRPASTVTHPQAHIQHLAMGTLVRCLNGAELCFSSVMFDVNDSSVTFHPGDAAYEFINSNTELLIYKMGAGGVARSSMKIDMYTGVITTDV